MEFELYFGQCFIDKWAFHICNLIYQNLCESPLAHSSSFITLLWVSSHIELNAAPCLYPQGYA